MPVRRSWSVYLSPKSASSRIIHRRDPRESPFSPERSRALAPSLCVLLLPRTDRIVLTEYLQLVPILELILDETSLLKDPSSTMTPSALLLQLTPILRVAFSRVLLDTHQTQSRSSETGIEVMSKYWKKNFDNDPSLQIPAELVDSLSILRKLSDIAVPSLLESQAEESVSQVAAVRTQGRKEEGKMETVAEMTEDGMGNESLEAPPPGQRASSPVQQESLVADPDSLRQFLLSSATRSILY